MTYHSELSADIAHGDATAEEDAWDGRTKREIRLLVSDKYAALSVHHLTSIRVTVAIAAFEGGA